MVARCQNSCSVALVCSMAEPAAVVAAGLTGSANYFCVCGRSATLPAVGAAIRMAVTLSGIGAPLTHRAFAHVQRMDGSRRSFST